MDAAKTSFGERSFTVKLHLSKMLSVKLLPEKLPLTGAMAGWSSYKVVGTLGST